MTDVTAARLRVPLAVKLVVLLAAVLAALGVFLVVVFGPRLGAQFEARSDDLLAQGRDAMRVQAETQVETSQEVLARLIQHTGDVRGRALDDLPLSLYDGDVAQIRRAIERSDDAHRARLQRNVSLLGQEMRRRARRRIDDDLADLQLQQETLAASFARELRGSSLALSGSVFGALVTLLGVGLYHAVIRPVRRLRVMTQRVAAGALDVTSTVRSRDEVGALAADLDAMVAELRDAREQLRVQHARLEELNAGLESQVAAKTEHLERALDDLRSTQTQLVHAAKMASLGTLAGGVAHEFNNLLGGIRGCVGEALEDEPDADRRETLEVIERASTRANDITRQLLRFARQPVGQMETIDLAPVVEEALTLLAPTARTRGVTVRRDVEAPLVAVADGGALHQVLVNLTTNALQAMEPGGVLSVRGWADPSGVVLEVQDTGRGIPPGHLERIFEPFFTTKDAEGEAFTRGSGLGLSVSYSIVEAHGGTLEPLSVEGEGTTMRVRLPRRGPTAQETDAR